MAKQQRGYLGTFGKVLKWGGFLLLALIVGAAAILFTIDFNNYRDTIEQRAEAVLGRDVSIKGDLSLALSLHPTIAVENLSIANADWAARSTMLQVQQLNARLDLLPLLSGNVEIHSISLIDPELHLETNSDGVGNWTFGDQGAGAGQQQQAQQQQDEGSGGTTVSVEDVEITNALITYRDGSTGQRMEVTFDRIMLHTTSPDSPLDVAVEGSYLDRTFKLSGTVGSPQALRNPDAVFPLDLEGSFAGLQFAVDGSMSSPGGGGEMQFTVTANADSLEQLSQIAGMNLEQLGPFAFEAQVSGDMQAMKVDLRKFQLAKSDLSGSLAAQLREEPPFVEAKLAANQILLDPFLDLMPDEQEQPQSGQLFGDEPIAAIDMLDQVNARLSLQAKLLQARDLQLRDLDVSGTLKDGNFEVELARTALYDGQIQGMFALKSGGGGEPRMQTRVNVDDFDVGRFLTEMQVTDKLAGSIDAEADISSVGRSPGALAAASNGQFHVTMGKGRINSQYVELLATDLVKVLLPGGADVATVNCGVTRFDIKDGVADMTQMLLDTEKITVGGDGTINLGSEKLDLTFVPRPQDPSLVSLATPINVTGTLTDPSFSLDRAAVAKDLATAIIGSAINPLGILVPFVTGGASGDGNACVQALKNAKSGAAPVKQEGAQSAPEKVIEGVGEGLKNLFGR